MEGWRIGGKEGGDEIGARGELGKGISVEE